MLKEYSQNTCNDISRAIGSLYNAVASENCQMQECFALCDRELAYGSESVAIEYLGEACKHRIAIDKIKQEISLLHQRKVGEYAACLNMEKAGTNRTSAVCFNASKSPGPLISKS